MAFADGDLVDADRPRRGHPRTRHLLPHVELVEVLDRGVVQPLAFRHRLDRHLAAERADVQRVPLRVARILCQPIELLYEHAAAPKAVDPPALELDEEAEPGHRKVTHTHRAPVVAAEAAMAAAGAACSFFRRRSLTTRARRSPNTPPSADTAVNPANENSERIDLRYFTPPSYRDRPLI